MELLFYLTIVLFSLGQLGRVSFFNQQINFYLYEVSLAVSILALLVKYRLKPIDTAWKNFKPVFLFLTVLLISLLPEWLKYNWWQNSVAALYFFRLVLYMLYFFYFRYHLKKNKKNSKTVGAGLLTLAILTIASTLIQYFLYPDLRNLIYQGWDPHLYRTFGVFFDTSIAAAIFGIFFLAVEQPIIKIVFLLLVALSFSRAVYLGLSLTLIYMFIQQKKFKEILIFLFLFLTLVLFIPKPSGEGVNLGRIYSVVSRGQDYVQGIGLWKKRPLLGYGYNRIRFIRSTDSVHSASSFSSSFLTILVSAGALGLLAFVGVLNAFAKASAVKKGVGLYLIIFLSIVSLFDNVLLHPFILFLLLIILSDR